MKPFAVLSCALLVLASCTGDDPEPTDTDTTDTDTDTDPEQCGDFTLTPTAWTWQPYGTSAGTYTFTTLLEGALLESEEGYDCFFFRDRIDHNRLVLSWGEGVEPVEITTFGPRSCNVERCEIGDILQTSENPDLQAVVDLHGLPEEACGHVFNADLIEHTHCAPLTEAE
jgi:hypothetical protein